MPDPNSTSIPSDPARPTATRRSFFRRPLGWIVIALALLLLVVALLPSLAGGFVASRGAAVFGERFQGRLEIGSAKLAWFGEQEVREVRLLDPSGAEVARATAILPPLTKLISAGSGRIGKIVVTAQADLVADDAGTTNLQRALAPRKPAEPKKKGDGDGDGFDVAKFARDLDVDLRVEVPRLSWSDADTRRLGRPFAVEGALLTVVAKPKSPIVAHANGRIAGEEAGTLALDAEAHGPIDPKASWPLGRTTATARVEKFSTALVDGLAGLSGDLVEVLGPTFGLSLDASAQSSESAVADAALEGAKARVALHAELENGEVVAVDRPFLVATTPMPRAILERLLRAKLPADASVALADGGAPWTVRIPRLRVAVPGPEARDLASLRPALERAEIELEVDLPGSATIETAELRAKHLEAVVSGIRMTASAKPNQPLVAHFDAELEAGSAGKIRADATVPGAFAVLAGGAIPPVDLDARIEGLSTLALGDFAGQGTRLTTALGPTASLSIQARRANLEGGNVRIQADAAQLAVDVTAKIAQGALTIDAAAPSTITWTPTAEFVAAEIAPKLPAGTKLSLEGAANVGIPALSAPLRDERTGAFAGVDALLAGLTARVDLRFPVVVFESDETRAAGSAARLRDAVATFEVAAGAPPKLRFAAVAALEGTDRPAGRIEAEARPHETLAALAKGAAPSGDVELSVRDLDVVVLEKIAGKPDLLVPLLGPKLEVVARASGPDAGAVDVAVTGTTARATFRGKTVGGRFVAQGDDGLDVSVQVTPELLRAHLGPSLPEGTRVELAGTGPSSITITLRDLSTPLEAPDVARRIADTSGKLEVALPPISYADAKTDASGRPLVLADTRLSAAIAPSSKPSVRLRARVEDASPGEVDVEVSALDPVEKLKEEGGWKTFRAAARVRMQNVPTAIVDAAAGQDGLIVEALGPRIQVEVEAPDVALDRGAFEVRAQGGQTKLALAGKLEDGALVIEGANALDADLALGPLVMERVVGKAMPFLRKASFLVPAAETAVASSTELAPFLLNSSDVRFALGKDLSKLDGVFSVDLGTLSFRGLPMLEQLGVVLEATDVRLPAFTIPVRKGVAYYDKLPIRIGGRDVLFDGSVRLTDGEMTLGTVLPLAMFGKKFEKELGKVRQFLPPDTAIPVKLSGTWDKPRIGFQEGFLQNLIEQAAGQAGSKGLEDVLDGLLGGKKKKKKDG